MPRAVLAPGFFGKMPHSGDFVVRRLPGDFVAVWDRFAALHLVPLLRKGVNWPDGGLRFILGPDQAGSAAWAGLVLPSRDTIGRVFPLTVAAAVEFNADPAAMAQYFADITGAAQDAAGGLIDAGELDLALEGCDPPQLKPELLAPLLLTLPGESPVECSLADPAAALSALFGEKVPGG